MLDILFPRECVGCWKTGSYLCSNCKKTLYAHPEICPFCHKASIHFQTCCSCKKEGYNAIEGIIVGFAYQELIKKLILKLKFYHKYDVTDFLAQRLALAIQTTAGINKNDPIIVSFIPSHRRRHYLEKGYNQSELLAKSLAKELNLLILPIAKKTRYTTSQVKLNKQERQKNLKQAFILLDLQKIPTNATLLLIDDILTTGSTLLTLANKVKETRPDIKIWGAVIARNMK